MNKFKRKEMRSYIEYLERRTGTMTAKDYNDIKCFMGTKNPILKSVINRLQYGTSINPATTRVNRALPPTYYVPFQNDSSMDYHFHPTYR
mgnify:CR=1 FL=1